VAERKAGGPAEVKYTPLEFAREVLEVELWSKQEEVLAALPEHRRVAVKSGNGLGKGFCAAVAVLWFRHCHDPAIVLSTAPTFRQVRYILWRQIRRLHRKAKDTLGGKMLDTRWELAEDRFALGLCADTADQFQGFHSPNMLIVVDEAEGVSDEIHEAIEAVTTAADPLLLLIGNPTTVSGAFRRAFYQERHLYKTITISALDSPNVQAGKMVIPGLTSAKWVGEHRETWGEDNPIFRARVLGEFPDQAEDTLIRLSDIEAAAHGPDLDAADPGAGSQEEEVVLAVDVDRFGSGRSVILRRQGRRVRVSPKRGPRPGDTGSHPPGGLGAIAIGPGGNYLRAGATPARPMGRRGMGSANRSGAAHPEVDHRRVHQPGDCPGGQPQRQDGEELRQQYPGQAGGISEVSGGRLYGGTPG
jgi:hypothetical protein